MIKPLISVIITVYNTAPYLNKCFDSVFSQNCDYLEIIIVNDGSTDNSLEICEAYKQKYENVIIIDKKNGGASDARNAGLKVANGDYIHFIDSDDFLIYDKLYEDIKSIAKAHAPDIIFSLNKEYTNIDYIEYGKMPLYNSDGFFEGDVLLDVLKNKYVMTLTCPVNKMFSKELLIKNDLFFTLNIDHEEDEWLPRVISCAKNAFFFNKFIYGVRVGRAGSISNTINEEILARRGRSKMYIADTGIKYMLSKNLDYKTLQYIAEHYWEYMIDAVLNTQNLTDKKLKSDNYNYIKGRKDFFKNYKLLTSRNHRTMGWMFVHLGIKFTSVIVGKRYAK